MSMSSWVRFSFFWLIFLRFSSHGEYRAFLLKITSADGTSFREVISTLDPWQYVGYYPLASGEGIQYTRTWKCMGRTNDRPICPAPETINPDTQTGMTSPPPASGSAQPIPPAPAAELPASQP